MASRIWSVLLIVLIGGGLASAQYTTQPTQIQTPALRVVVIGPSVSTSMEARAVLARLRWSETKNWKTADGILVIVRSALPLPLRSSYESVCDLKQDADHQLNIAGPNFHVYLFDLNDDLSVVQKAHQSYEAQ